MTKPFSPSELVARVKAHLERYKKLVGSAMKEENEVIEAGGLKIDRTARRVYVDGVEKNLTTKEFDLLFFLAQHPNRVFSKEELLEEVWQLSPVGADIATVTVHIKKIREKIEKDTSVPFPSSLSAQMRPPCSSMIFFAIEVLSRCRRFVNFGNCLSGKTAQR